MEPEKYKLDINLQEESKHNPDTYILSPELRKAINVALVLDQPLILTGEPGTGKTQLAYKVAKELNEQTKGEFAEIPWEFHTKTTSTAQDLFYQYDAVGHFHSTNIAAKENINDASAFITLQALGKAIALTDTAYIESGAPLLNDKDRKHRSSVVLIDEIDKAPRDFPNDILNEIDEYRYTIKELKQIIRKSGKGKILIIMTSNSEKSLPAPFLRRCIFYHIPFPDSDQLLGIVSKKIKNFEQISQDKIENSIKHFMSIRERVKKKRPATSELISWLQLLEIEKFFENSVDFENLNEDQKKILSYSYSILIKDKDDMALVQ